MKLSTALRRGAWCILGVAVVRMGLAAFAGKLGSAGVAVAMRGYTRGAEGFFPALFSVLGESPAAVAGIATLLTTALILGTLANVITVGGVLAHLRAPGSIGAFVNHAIRWAPAMLTSAIWVSVLRLLLAIPCALVGAGMGRSAGFLVGAALWALTMPIHDHARAMIVDGRATRRYGPRPLLAALAQSRRRLLPLTLGAVAWIGTIACSLGAAAVGLAFADHAASAWAIRGLGLFAVTLTVLRISLAVDED